MSGKSFVRHAACLPDDYCLSRYLYSMTSLVESTAALVREELAHRGIRQRQAAPAIGLSQQALSDRLTGRTPFTLPDLERLAELLGIDVLELLQPRQVGAEPVVNGVLLGNAQAERARREAAA